MLERYRRRRAAIVERLGGKCTRCGSTERLEIDHVDPKRKAYNIARRLPGLAADKLEAEIKKCQLLCRECHTDKTLTETGKQRARCGTLSGYRYCRCEACRAAKREHSRAYRQRLAR